MTCNLDGTAYELLGILNCNSRFVNHADVVYGSGTHEAARYTAKYDKAGLLDAIRMIYPTRPAEECSIYGAAVRKCQSPAKAYQNQTGPCAITVQ